MHLLHSRRGVFQEASDIEVPENKVLEYAILSHCWGKSEASFQSYQPNEANVTLGSQKIRKCCAQAVLDEYDWVWIDTCCINKSSSAELTESINSMYTWYQNAAVCYAYLFDVQVGDLESFRNSRWFKRGWTLQELLAPKDVQFFDKDWNPLGNKQEFATLISEITGIDSAVLEGIDWHRYSVAQRMSWASERDTKRLEDKAYCLMGLFDVNMPLLYGEGQKAFVRLQEEIIRQIDDHSIFAWSKDGTKLSGLLAPDPAYFKNCGTVVSRQFSNSAEPFQMTNRGLSMKLSVTPWTADTYLSWLDCERIGSGRLGIFLQRLAAHDQYARVEVNGQSLKFDQHLRLYYDDWVHNYISLRIPQAVNLQLDGNFLVPRSYGFQFVAVEHFERDFCENARFWVHKGQWCDEQRLACIPEGLCGTAVIVCHATAHWSGIRSVTLGFDFEFNPVCFVDDFFRTDRWLETPDVCSYSEISDRCLQDHDWCTIHEGSRVYRREDHNNVWAVKGHRIRGLDVMLMESPTISLSKDLRIIITRVVISERLVWTCSLTTRQDPYEMIVRGQGCTSDFTYVYERA